MKTISAANIIEIIMTLSGFWKFPQSLVIGAIIPGTSLLDSLV